MQGVTPRIPVELDIENLVGYFLIKIMRPDNECYAFELHDGTPPLDIETLTQILRATTIYTFNGTNYDLPILVLALAGATHQQLKEAGDLIIEKRTPWWDFYRIYGLEVPDWIDHVDLFDVAPGVAIGLKMYMGRCHADRIQDLPVAHNVPVPPPLFPKINNYCGNDLIGNRILRTGLAERLALRESMSAQYGVDLRSKSDAQIAEAVIKSQLGFKPDKRFIEHGYKFKYEPPPYIQFATAPMQELLAAVRTADFEVTNKLQAYQLGLDPEGIRTGVVIPPELKNRAIRIGSSSYKLGIGGLHSQDSCVNYKTNDEYQLWDIDVKSEYPSIIISLGMYPHQLGPGFLKIYEKIYRDRLAAKKAGTMTESDGLKIVLNGTFGKLFSLYSILYAPELGIRTTMTGQLSLLMLIEMMELCGISAVSANTDGIVLRVPKGLHDIMRSTVTWWERTTGLEMEFTPYRAIYMRDVNNYVAFPLDPAEKIKRKGVFMQGGLLSGMQGKHPDEDICADAVVAYLDKGVPVEQTVMACKDIRKFLQIRAVKGGAVDLPTGVAISDGEYLGKAVRWYISGRQGYIGYSGTGNKVAGSDGATPIMELPKCLPIDINYGHYIQVALDMLKDIGVK